MARPTKYSESLVNEFCARIADGRSVKSICEDDDMPSRPTIFDWIGKYPEFSNKYMRAKEMQADALFDETLDIADLADKEDHQIARLRIDTRKWIAGKLRPKKYGDKVDAKIEHSGAVGIIVETGVPRGED